MKPTRKQIADLLRRVDDPELGVNIVDLGLVYDLEFSGGTLAVELTMTTPACPLSDYIKKHIRHVTGQVKQIETVQIEIVWDPSWSPEMMAPEVREERFQHLQYPPQYT
jgi:metal-sulfur cluster biosynthetic enzyme